jgi:hypothetical protein
LHIWIKVKWGALILGLFFKICPKKILILNNYSNWAGINSDLVLFDEQIKKSRKKRSNAE